MLLSLMACLWLDEGEVARLRDGDADGVPVWDDCDDADAARGASGSYIEDADGDGVGGATLQGCGVGVATDGDCDDHDASRTAPSDWYPDADGDGHGADGAPTTACDAPAPAWLTTGDDCDDTNNAIFPGAAEQCDTLDQDCDGRIDECDADRLTLRVRGEYSDQLGYWPPAFADLDGDGVDELTVPALYSVATWVVPGGTDGTNVLYDVAELQTTGVIGTNAVVTYGELDGVPGPDLAMSYTRDLGGYVENGVALRFAGRDAFDASTLIAGESDTDWTGFSILLEDIDGDGQQDVLTGAPSHSEGCGSVFLLYGPFDSETVNVNNRYMGGDGARFATTCRSTTDWLQVGWSLAAVRDASGDVAALAFGGPGHDTYRGAAYLWTGESRPTGIHDLFANVDELAAPDASRWRGLSEYDYFGNSVAAADLDGDGADELLIGSPFQYSSLGSTGVVYVVDDAVANRDASIGEFHFIEGEPDDEGAPAFGAAIEVMGDVDGDGLEDVAITAPTFGGLAERAGAVYLFHHLGDVGAATEAEERIYADEAGIQFGWSIRHGGDFDGDALPDLAIGAPSAAALGGEIRIRPGSERW